MSREQQTVYIQFSAACPSAVARNVVPVSLSTVAVSSVTFIEYTGWLLSAMRDSSDFLPIERPSARRETQALAEANPQSVLRHLECPWYPRFDTVVLFSSEKWMSKEFPLPRLGLPGIL